MQPVNLFHLASRQAEWLAVRQSAIAGNIANVNTPGYGTAEIEPFEKVLDQRRVALTATREGHFATGVTEAAFHVSNEDGGNSVLPSENTVVLENELMKAGDVRRSFELNTAIIKAFHRMSMLSVKG